MSKMHEHKKENAKTNGAGAEIAFAKPEVHTCVVPTHLLIF